jgi:hypothetical protein
MNELKFVCRIGNVIYLITGTENRIDAVEKLMKYLRDRNIDIFIENLEITLVDFEVV